MEPDKQPDNDVGPSDLTLDGKRLRIEELNIEAGDERGPLRRFLRNLSLFLAGMYTGESCGGTPHSHRNRRRRDRRSGPL